MANGGSPSDSESMIARADQLCEGLAAQPTVPAADEAARLLDRLRALRAFDRLCALGDLVCRLRPDDATAHRLYAQGLIETGRLTAAVSLIEACACSKVETAEQVAFIALPPYRRGDDRSSVRCRFPAFVPGAKARLV